MRQSLREWDAPPAQPGHLKERLYPTPQPCGCEGAGPAFRVCLCFLCIFNARMVRKAAAVCQLQPARGRLEALICRWRVEAAGGSKALLPGPEALGSALVWWASSTRAAAEGGRLWPGAGCPCNLGTGKSACNRKPKFLCFDHIEVYFSHPGSSAEVSSPGWPLALLVLQQSSSVICSHPGLTGDPSLQPC